MKLKLIAMLLLLSACCGMGRNDTTESVAIPDLSSVDVMVNGTEYAYIDILDDGKNFNGPQYNLTNNGEWAVGFDYGTVTGDAICSVRTGKYDKKYGNVYSYNVTQESELEYGDEDSRNCWCSVTGYRALDGGKQSLSESLWVYNSAYKSLSECAMFCTSSCAQNAKSEFSFRKVLYDVAM